MKPEPGSENRSPELFGGEEPSNNEGGNESLVRASAWTWVGGAACWPLQVPYNLQLRAPPRVLEGVGRQVLVRFV